MKELYFTIAGCMYRYGLSVFKPGMTVTLVKEPENKYDREAIRVELGGLGTVGYIANSPSTVRGTSMSAGRLYDKIPQKTEATVVYVLSDSVICAVHPGTVQQPGLETLPDDDGINYRPSDTADLNLYENESPSYLIPDATETEETDSSSAVEAVTKLFASMQPDNTSVQEPKTTFTEPPAPTIVTNTVAAEDISNIAMAMAAATPKEPEPAPAAPAYIMEEKQTAAAKEQKATDTPTILNTDTVQTAVRSPLGKTAKQEPEEDQVSPEDIANALKAALAGLTVGQSDSAEEDPDAEYIYGTSKKTAPEPQPHPEEPVKKEVNPNDLMEQAKAMLSGGASGLSAADFFSALTGGTAASPAQPDATPSSTDSEPAVTEPEPAVEPDPVPQAEPEYVESFSRAPGLSINTARFPEEEERASEPAMIRKEPDIEPAPAQDIDLPETITESASEPESIPEPEPVIQETAAESPEILPDHDTPAAPAAEQEADLTAAPEEPDATGTEPAEAPETGDDENVDDLTKPLIYDESDLDENLAQLHLGDIDATYLSESFLENLKKKLKETH